MLVAQFMVILDVSVVNVALPSIGRAMSFSSGDYQWVVSAYVLLSGGLLLFGGRLADLFERRTIFLTGLAVFTMASLVSATASSAATLIVSRAAQGAGAALLTPAALSIIVTTYAGRQRATAFAVWGTIGSMGIAAGVLVGGLLTSTFGWRSVFFVNVPIGLVAAALTLHKVARGTSSRVSAAWTPLEPLRWSPACWPWSTPSRAQAPTAGPRRGSARVERLGRRPHSVLVHRATRLAPLVPAPPGASGR